MAQITTNTTTDLNLWELLKSSDGGTTTTPTDIASGINAATNIENIKTALINLELKQPALGQALAASSSPVVLTAAQIATLTPLSIVNAIQSGAWTVTANTGLAQPLTDTQLRASALPVSAAALPLPNGAATASNQTTSNSNLASIAANTPALGQALAAASIPVVLTAAQITALSAPIELADNQKDIHGQALGVSRITQVTAKFFQQAPSNFLNITTSGNATATGPTLGLAVFATGAAAVASSLLAQTPTTVMYSTAYEAWASQAAVFTAPTSATSFQRLGIYDAVNGYFFGFSGLTFGLTIRSNSVDTFIARTAWNADTLVGAAGSKFTSGGVPVALTPTNINMYRVRYGWYGAVSARLEIYSPDGDWVLVHVVRTANTVATANITNPDLPMCVEVSKPGTDSTNLRILCGGWAAGITSPASGALLSGQGSIAALNASVGVPTTGLGGLSFSITGTWIGTLSFQHSLDGLLWIADNALNNVTESFSTSTTSNGSFSAAVGSFKFYRIIATAWTSGSASVVYNGSSASNLVVAQIPQLQSGFRSNPTITRAANTNGYFANDAYGTSFELTNIGSSGGFILLTGVRITFNLAALPAGMGGFVLFLYTATPPSAVADNGAFSVPVGDRASLITPTGIDLGSAVLGLGGGSVVLNAANINEQFRLAPGSTSLFGYLVTRNAFTPAAVSETASLVAMALGV